MTDRIWPYRAASSACNSTPALARQAFDVLETLEPLKSTTPYGRAQTVYGPDDPADHWYRVVVGMTRKCTVTADGRRQIVDFLLPGDFFGLVNAQEHHFAVEAVSKGTIVARYSRRRAEQLADADPRLARRLRELAFETTARLQARTLILGRKSALDKVAAFVVEMAERSLDGPADTLMLGMSRYDIGDYLALSSETVSRTLTELQQRGLIVFRGRRWLRIVDRGTLQEGLEGERLTAPLVGRYIPGKLIQPGLA
ncbi:MAG: helix-turn-helix domain-containing protein [Geminicoccaceae bacterium]